jgi:uncharacterized protein YjbJ (UPF0337 family)
MLNQREGDRNELGSSGRQLEAAQGHVKEQWGKLTDDQLDVIAGKRDQLAGKIQEAYGVRKRKPRSSSAWEKRQREIIRSM